MIHLAFWLLVAHFVADYPLQGDTTALNKNRNARTPLQQHVPWYYWMTAHALMHGGAVALVTGSVELGFAETVCHWLIDFAKCEKVFGIHADQALHVACKVAWLLVVAVRVAP